VRIYVSFSFLSILDTFFMYLRSCDHIVIANLVLVDIHTFEVVITVIHLSLHVLFLFFLYKHVSYILYV